MSKSKGLSMDYKYIIYEKDKEIARLTLNRPEKLNVFDFPSFRASISEMSAI